MKGASSFLCGDLRRVLIYGDKEQNKCIKVVHWRGWDGHSGQSLSQLVATLQCLLSTPVQFSLGERKEKHLDHIPIRCIVHALLSHIKPYSPSSQERAIVLMRVRLTEYWIQIKTLASRETPTRDNYIEEIRSKKLTLLKKILLCTGTCSDNCFNQLLNFIKVLLGGSACVSFAPSCQSSTCNLKDF